MNGRVIARACTESDIDMREEPLSDVEFRKLEQRADDEERAALARGEVAVRSEIRSRVQEQMSGEARS